MFEGFMGFVFGDPLNTKRHVWVAMFLALTLALTVFVAVNGTIICGELK